MKKFLNLSLAAASIVVAGFTYVHATETGTMMCQGAIVSIGDTAGEVISKCGQPATSSKREEKRVVEDARRGRVREIKTVSIDDWIFNFGPNQFQYRLLLENGTVARIESLNYGY